MAVPSGLARDAFAQSGIAFRPITDDDLPFLSALYASTREAELAIVPWPDAAKQAFLADQFGLQHRYYQAQYAGAQFLMIERHGVPIGRVYVHRTPSEIRLMEIALVAPERGKGLGTEIIGALIDEARANGSQLTLHVEPNNPACRLYERLGFRVIESRGVYLFLCWNP